MLYSYLKCIACSYNHYIVKQVIVTCWVGFKLLTITSLRPLATVCYKHRCIATLASKFDGEHVTEASQTVALV